MIVPLKEELDNVLQLFAEHGVKSRTPIVRAANYRHLTYTTPTEQEVSVDIFANATATLFTLSSRHERLRL